jgi:drug/metabolite transporter (DMT)-like permease
MTWLLFCFLSIAFTAAYSLVSKKILSHSEDHHPIAYASALFGAVSMFSIVAYILSGVHINDFASLASPQVLAILSINVLCYTLAPSVYYRALKYLPISEVTILYAQTGIYILVLGLLLGTESFLISRLVGGILIIGSVVGLTLKTGNWKNSVYTKLMILATIIYAIASVTDQQIISHRYFPTLLFQAINFGLPALLILVFNPQSRQHLKKIYSKKLYPIVLLNGAFFFVSFFAIFKAYSSGGAASQVAFVLSTETIIMVILAALFLKERRNLLLKLAAAAVCGLGVFLLR